MKKAIVIGGSGFVGRHLIRTLAKEPDCRIVSMDIREPAEKVPGVEYLIQDVRNLSTIDVHTDATIIYNLAAIHTTPGHEYWEYYDTNIRGAIEIVSFAHRHSIKEIVFTSSISVYGPCEIQKDEDSIPDPNSAYGWSKLLAEGVFRLWNEESSDSKLLIVRPAVVFGEAEGGNFSRLAKLMKLGIFVYPGRKDTVKACIYVKDLVNLIEQIRNRTDRFSLFNACYPERYQIQEVVGEFKKYFSKVRTFLIPEIVMVGMAKLGMLLPTRLGIHPERILKLTNSTNIYPKVLVMEGIAPVDRLSGALKDWNDDTEGRFD